MAKLAYYADTKAWTGKVGTAIVPRFTSVGAYNWFLRCPKVLSARFGIHVFRNPSPDPAADLGHTLIIKEIAPAHRAIPNYPGSWGRPVREETIVLRAASNHIAAAIASFVAKAVVDGRVDLEEALVSQQHLVSEDPRPWMAAVACVLADELFSETSS